jgi:excisionase family DNA binding protein
MRRPKEVPVPQHPALPNLLTIEQLAEHLGVTPRHVRRLVAERRVPYVRWRRFIRFDPSEISAWLDSARQPEAPLSPAHRGRIA